MIELLEGAAGVGAVAWYLSSFYVGVRLLAFGIRSDNAPARWIGTYLFFAMGLGSVFYMLGALRSVVTGEPMTDLERVMIAMHFVATLVANYGLATFTQRVFRRESTIARVVVWLMLGILAAGAVGHALTTRFSPSFESAWGGAYLVVPVLSNLWTAAESLAYHGLMRRRLAVGLGDPQIANRFLLYGIGAATAAVLLSINVVELQIMERLNPGWNDGLRVVSLASMAVLGLVCAAAYLFAFFPPRWYARRLVAPDASEA
ncbi:MAG: hypothetical protein H6748_10140 [Spirochaetaceae bacterium]|nr:hypothetical protein [Myxococcales bacterium]MCB9724393.1 hypothetical protein [Spirochaetaceae bacterium]HPG24814.1 hypothetical protein [Myxococcota bacterium]